MTLINVYLTTHEHMFCFSGCVFVNENNQITQLIYTTQLH